MLKTMLALSLMVASSRAELPSEFIRAIHLVETGGRHGPIKGDGGRALGPLQIHFSYWKDSGVPGRYEQCADLEYSKKVMNGYFKRYAPKALKENNLQVLARIHNGGLNGAKNKLTFTYWQKVKKYLAHN